MFFFRHVLLFDADEADHLVVLHEAAQDVLGDPLGLERFHARREELERGERQLRRDLVGGRLAVLHREAAEVLQEFALLAAPFAPVVH